MRMAGMNLEARGLYIPRPVNPVSHLPEFHDADDPLFPLQSGFTVFVGRDFGSHIHHPSRRHGSRDFHTPCIGISRYWKLSRILSRYRIRYPQSFGRQLGSLQLGRRGLVFNGSRRADSSQRDL
jgi:hypothetical protein